MAGCDVRDLAEIPRGAKNIDRKPASSNMPSD